MCIEGMLQMLGTAGKLIRLMIFVLIGVIIWRLWYYVFPIPPDNATIMPPQIPFLKESMHGGLHHHTETLDVPVPLQLRVGVFYEALCPDSRDFIMRQLMPVYDVMNDVLAIDLIPYGKASSRIQSDGRKVFSCQHGEKECKANIVHACVAKHVENERRRLNIVNCMIDINLRRNQEPIAVGNKCVTKYDENWSLIEKCSIGEEGENLLYHLGKMTDDLTPKVYFIPTISLDDKLDNQKLILRDFKQAVCDAYTGPKHSVCTF